MLSPLKTTEKGWEHPHDFHLTLLFIGEVEKGLLPSLLARMEEIPKKPFTMKTTNFHFFSRRIMYLGFEHSPEIYSLRKEILRLYPEFYRKEEKEFVPHITVKRWQRYEHGELVKALEENPEHPLTIRVDGLSLFQSKKDAENRKYHVINRVSF